MSANGYPAGPSSVAKTDSSLECTWDNPTPKILLVGLSRSGKSSVRNVVFGKRSPHETIFQEATKQIELRPCSSVRLFPMHIADFPGDWQWPESEDQLRFQHCRSIVCVLDAQEDNKDALSMMANLIGRAHALNPKINFDIFIHKVDGDMFLNDSATADLRREVQGVMDNLAPSVIKSTDFNIEYHCTSIYDHSIFEAFSKVVQKMMPQLPMLEHLLELFVSNCNLDRAFLFDVTSKLYVASDASAAHSSGDHYMMYELCSDVIDVVIDVSCIYGSEKDDQPAPVMQDDQDTQCIIHLTNNTLIYLKMVDRFLALVCVVQEQAFDQQSLIDYNITVFRDALLKLFKIPSEVTD